MATSDTPPAPAAPAGPGAAGLARSAGLAEAVCAPAGQSDGGSSAASAAVAAAAGGGWDMKEAENMIKVSRGAVLWDDFFIETRRS